MLLLLFEIDISMIYDFTQKIHIFTYQDLLRSIFSQANLVAHHYSASQTFHFPNIHGPVAGQYFVLLCINLSSSIVLTLLPTSFKKPLSKSAILLQHMRQYQPISYLTAQFQLNSNAFFPLSPICLTNQAKFCCLHNPTF